VCWAHQKAASDFGAAREDHNVTKIEAMLFERMNVRRWLVACLAIAVLFSLAAWFVGFRNGKATAAANMEEVAGLVSADVRNSDPLASAGLARAADRSLRVASASHLQAIGLGCVMHANTHAGAGPDDVETIVRSGDLDKGKSACPIPGQHYVYRGYRDSWKDDDVVAYESPGSADGFNVLYKSGVVKWVSRTEGDSILRALK
jgi:hypothetical protein